MSERMIFDAQATVKAQAPAAGGAPRPPRFSMVAHTGVPVRLAGWRHPVVIDFAGLTIPRQQIPIRFNHDVDKGVGHTERVGVEGGSLVAAGVISRDTPEAREVVASAKNGFTWQASIGSSADEVQWVKEGEQATVNGKQYGGPLNVVRKSTLGEISFVDRGADGNTSVSVAALAVAANLECSEVAAMSAAQRAELAALTDDIARIRQRTLATLAAARQQQEEAAFHGAGGARTRIDLAIACAKERSHRSQMAALDRRAADRAVRAALDRCYIDDLSAERAGRPQSGATASATVDPPRWRSADHMFAAM